MIDGSGGLIGFDVSSGGAAVLDNTRAARLFKIVSGTNPYAASEVYLNESDGTRPLTGVYDVTAAMKLLHEVNGVNSVKADVVVEATPNQFGTGFTFTAPPGSGCGLPFVFKIQVGTSVAKSGGNVTDVYARYRTVTVDENGCVSISAPTCETAATAACSTSENTNYYCIDGVCWKYYDGIVPGSYDAGPFSTPELCDAGCPFPPAGEGEPSCCTGQSFATLTATLSGGEGSKTLTWNGTSWQSAPFTLTCVAGSFILNFSQSCELTWSNDGGETFTGIIPAGSTSCGPPLSSTGWGFAPGGTCGTLTVSVAP